jgi:DNA-binding NtrC family response regulator
VDTIPIDVRFIAASNTRLDQLVKEKKFREELLFRLNVVTLDLPPLRERKGDIPILAEYFLRRAGQKTGKDILYLSEEFIKAAMTYPWPGNVRELMHVIERAVAIATGPMITATLLPTNMQTLPAKTLEEVEKDYISQILRETHGNKLKAAEILGIDRKTLYRKIMRYNLDTEYF